ncbi:MAG: EAL domain-containing protein [Pseudomonadota bacterium]|nr:EAL domain-containing protein [Pseudomonadota bacterium]
MSANIGFHIVGEDDGAATGIWGPFVLKSAFQPIFAFEAGKLSVIAFEGLLRPFRDGESWPPLTFLNSIATAERLAVEKLAHTLHLLNAARFLPAEAAIFINFDPSVLIDHAVAEATIHDMRQTLADTGIDPHRIVCEVTEKEAVSQEALFTLVASLRASGFGIAVDDYGADDSDMNRIRDLHPDIVKFDAQWIARLMESGPGYALLTAMVSSFAEQGIRTVFEGIEENWQLELAEKSGATMVQGFALARPELAPTSFSSADEPQPREHHLPQPPILGAPPVPRAVGELRHTKAFGRRTQPL